VTSDPVTLWISQVKEGERAAVQPLMEHYFQRLVGLARARLRALPQLAAQDEDVALSAFKSLCLGAEAGRFPNLQDRDDLWRLLAVITIRKAIDLQRRRRPEDTIEPDGMGQFLSRETAPDLAVELADECRRLLDKLGDEQLQTIALWKVEGHTNDDIARRLGCVERSVERKLHRIRLLWQAELAT
jgi:DNA-directed RNA polymerase specialized sigma24 family protein